MTVKSESHLLNFLAGQTKPHQKYMWGEYSLLRSCKLSNTCIYILNTYIMQYILLNYINI